MAWRSTPPDTTLTCSLHVCIARLKARVATVDEALTDCKRQLQAAKLAYDQQLDKQGQLHR